MNVLSQFATIKAFVFDVDGVMTNGNLLVTENGDLLRTMNIKDGYATQLAIKKGYHIWVISGGKQNAVGIRLQKLGVTETHIAVEDKAKVLSALWQKYNVTPSSTLYMGDDVPDYHVMQLCGLPTCPNDAIPEIKSIAKYISPISGGNGCVRDVIEKVLKLNGDWPIHHSIA
jgi:3-deoxy-D-manno-octulosonate 8-phosphate phosphatase (KDO 8-P phosphatase)